MAVRFEQTNWGIRARRDGQFYDIDQLSDGERAALLVVAAIIVQDPFSAVVIDEPERHLHPSISAPLVTAAVRIRNDISFIFSSHDMDLVAQINPDFTLHVRDSRVISVRPEQRSFDVEVIEAHSDIPEELKRDILGSRKKILFIEGQSSSIDVAVYGAIYPDWKIVPKGSCEKVISSILAMRDNPKLHWYESYGIIDADGREKAEQATLGNSGIFCLSVPSIESLFYLPAVVSEVCNLLQMTEGGMSAIDRFAQYENMLEAFVREALPDIISRRSVWQIARILTSSAPSVSRLREGRWTPPVLDSLEIANNVEKDIDRVLRQGDNAQTIASVPIKNSNIPARIAAAIGCPNLNRYIAIVLQQIQSRSTAGINIMNEMSKYVPELPMENNVPFVQPILSTINVRPSAAAA
jgi:energy-coupling factor transporter ATP-binding protein EcfA2